MMVHSIAILGHTTSSLPRPHIQYIIEVTLDDGTKYQIFRRYSEFSTLKASMGDSHPIPPKHAMTTSFSLSAWIDDDLIAERKSGFAKYLSFLIQDTECRAHPVLHRFLSRGVFVQKNYNHVNDFRPDMVYRALPGIGRTLDDDTNNKPIAASYYPAWSANDVPPNKVNFSLYDVLFFAFVIVTRTAEISWDDGSESVLRKLVSGARSSGMSTKIVLSVGGWSGSHWYSEVMSSSSNRSKLVRTLVGVVDAYGLDGIDVDWEYPNAPGSGNPHSSADAGNLLDFFTLLRKELGPARIISAAVTHVPWLGKDGKPLSNVAAYAAQITFVNIMNYDVSESSPKPGPNAPLGDLCGTNTQPAATAQSAFAQWTAAGMPASKLLLGLPLYGYVSKSTAKKLTGSSSGNGEFPLLAHPKYPPLARGGGTSALPSGDLSSMWGQQVSFNQLVNTGTLVDRGDGNYNASNGYTQGWDNCSDTPYMYNVEKTTVVTYDDTWSLASKAQFAKKSGMGGCFTWSLDQDDGCVLQDVIRSNLRK
ncbi:glycoside hydrolase family 18 protein [Crassisporium funariophilum]|nr:glycoside hydrolase family 18 protein [Crassisporium funariophilum]